MFRISSCVQLLLQCVIVSASILWVNSNATAACPTVQISINENVSTCYNAIHNIDFADILTNVAILDPDGESTGLNWYSDATLSTLTNPDELTYVGDNCEVYVLTYHAGLGCIDGSVTAAGTLTVRVYPGFDVSWITLNVGICEPPTVISTCDNYSVNAGSSVPTTVNLGDSGTGGFSITFNDGTGFSSCFTNVSQVAYDCPDTGCPITNVPASGTQSICAGNNPDFNVVESTIEYLDPYNTFDGIAWFSDIDLTVPVTSSDWEYTGDNCTPFGVMAYAGIICSDDGSVVPAGDVNIIIYPPFDDSFVNFTVNNCEVPIVQSTCSNYSFNATSVPTVVNQGDEGTATWELVFNDGTGTTSCFTQLVSIEYSCGCNTPLFNVLTDSLVVCTGTSNNAAFELTTDVSVATINWYANTDTTTVLNTGESFVPDTPATYYAQIVNIADITCTSELIPFTLYESNISIVANVNTNNIFEGESVNLGSTVSDNLDLPITYEWSSLPNTNLSCTNCESPSATPNTTSTFIVSATNSAQCTSTDSVEVTVSLPKQVSIPQGFSPNDDGINDVFRIVGYNITSLNMSIYDRWGKNLFSLNTTNLSEGWDGTSKGINMNMGVYVYTINVSFEDGTSTLYSGSISLIQ